MTSKRLDKKQRKQLREQRRVRQNKRSASAGEYEVGKTNDRKKKEGDWTEQYYEEEE